MTTSAIWSAILISSLIIFVMRIIGYTLPSSFLSNAKLQRITALIPIVLLAALVGSQTLISDQEVVIDHRLAGLAAGAIALRFKASFLVVMLVAGFTGAIIYNFI